MLDDHCTVLVKTRGGDVLQAQNNFNLLTELPNEQMVLGSVWLGGGFFLNPISRDSNIWDSHFKVYSCIIIIKKDFIL